MVVHVIRHPHTPQSCSFVAPAKPVVQPPILEHIYSLCSDNSILPVCSHFLNHRCMCWQQQLHLCTFFSFSPGLCWSHLVSEELCLTPAPLARAGVSVISDLWATWCSTRSPVSGHQPSSRSDTVSESPLWIEVEPWRHPRHVSSTVPWAISSYRVTMSWLSKPNLTQP